MKCLTENSSAFQKAKRKQMLNEIDWFLTAIATTAFDKFNMTGEEVARFTNEVKYIAESLSDGYTTIDDYKKILEEEYHFRIT